jgi:hypothetical protein
MCAMTATIISVYASNGIVGKGACCDGYIKIPFL